MVDGVRVRVRRAREVVAQFGRDSVQAQAMGLTRTSERQTPTRKKRPGGGK